MDGTHRDNSSELRIDLPAERVWRGGTACSLRPKTWLVLRHLLQRPESLITKDELLDVVWPDAVVSEGTLNKSIGELRTALGDDRESPRFIETVPRRGFRWIGGESVTVDTGTADRVEPSPSVGNGGLSDPAIATFVGRDNELESLERAFERAGTGSRQVVFVTGEAGAGKSTLVDAFLARLQRDRPSVLMAHGQCIEAYGQHEPYRPLLEATERLAGRADQGAAVIRILWSKAPSWLRQMPSLGGIVDPVEGDAAMAPARMVREIAIALEEMSVGLPLVLVLEDAHWADLATTDVCNLLARRRDPARLLVIVTLRAADELVLQHPILATKTDLVSRGQATEVAVALFTPAMIESYLEARCSGFHVDIAATELVSWIHHQTAGNPLFVRILVDDLIERRVIRTERDGGWRFDGSLSELRDVVPDSLRELVESRVDRLPPGERVLIEAASVLRGQFTPSSVAAAAGIPGEEAEKMLESLARRGQVLTRAARGSCARSRRFSFVHSMVQRTLYDRIPPSRMKRLHLAAAAELERSSREDAGAVELALHYAMAHEPAQALVHLQRAAASVQRIPAPREVIVIREQILDLVEQSPGLPGHRRELVVAVMDLAEARQLAFAIVDAETAALCERVIGLAVDAEDGRECFRATMGIFSNRFCTGRYEEARQIGLRLLVAAERHQHPFMTKSAHFAVAGATYRLGNFDEARVHFEACLEHLADSKQTYGWDFHLMSMSHLALLAIHRGQPDEARRLVREAEAYGNRGGATPDAAVMPLFAYALAMLGDDAEAMVRVERALSQSDRIGAAAWIERARFVYGLLQSRLGGVDEGIRLMKESLARQARGNLQMDRSAYCALLAGEMVRRNLPGANAIVGEGIACMERTNERHFEPELRRLQSARS